MADWRSPYLEHLQRFSPAFHGLESAFGFLMWYAYQGHSALRKESAETWLSAYAEEGAGSEEVDASRSQLGKLWDQNDWALEPYLYRENEAGGALVWGMDRRKEEELAAWFSERWQSQAWDLEGVAQDGLDPGQVKALSLLRSAPVGLLSGGPGTGKTHVITAFLQGLDPTERRMVAVAAPTGRAASRINEQLGGLGSAQTLHSLLGLYGGYGPEPRWNRGTPLPYSAVIVDETSMLDTELMLSLVRALGPKTRLILVGDSFQLPSIAGGAVFRDLCNVARSLQSPILVELTKNHRLGRSGPETGLGLFFDKLRGWEQSDQMEAVEGMTWSEAVDSEKVVGETVELWERKLATLPTGSEAIRRWLGEDILLLPLRKGPWGIEAVQKAILERLRKGHRFEGMPLLVRANQRSLGLMNGDRGILRFHKGRWMVQFPGTASEPLSVPLSALESYDLGFALTIHQSQGSEFQRVRLAIPPGAQALLSRELIYTAVTRTRESLILDAPRQVLEECLRVGSVRSTLLCERLVKLLTGKLGGGT